ncbi:intermediate in Toll signal transduction pathway, putative [Ixodes scapularis]|uniref:Evolutionarily conserved signaling intermediate in Toll pathway, mitochondrial n=1 Tax=Ixodes scapularis TaxID=6945 RepID=B7PYZ8_IXOSC|nr:intermediate in Toll signal transduction pathway, putative [Ixodes scapularis]|eukprot:XP_002404254.1 intermediate in Toll signal transduction pathway, putative [Ixodes scapularis]
MSFISRQCCSVAARLFAGRVLVGSLNPRDACVLPYRCHFVRNLHVSRSHYFFRKKQKVSETRLALREEIFKSEQCRDREGFIEVIERFKLGNENRKGHVEFINVATKYLEEFNVHKDLAIYKMLFDLFPKGRYPPKNQIQAEFQHFPYHQDCALRLLDVMEYNAVVPDRELRQAVLDTFGFHSEVFKKFARMMYWMPKLKNLSPFPLPTPLPREPLELAKLAVRRMCVDLRTVVSVRETSEVKDSVDQTWVVSGQSPDQRQLVKDQPTDKPLRIEGPFSTYLRNAAISYFVLRAEPVPIRVLEIDSDDVSNIPLTMFGEKPPPKELVKPSTVHEQEDGIILALCATGTSSRDSLLSWLRMLQEDNAKLKEIPVIFTLRAPSKSLVTANQPTDEDLGADDTSQADDTSKADDASKADGASKAGDTLKADDALKAGKSSGADGPSKTSEADGSLTEKQKSDETGTSKS